MSSERSLSEVPETDTVPLTPDEQFNEWMRQIRESEDRAYRETLHIVIGSAALNCDIEAA